MLGRTALWFLLFLGVFELTIWAVFAKTRLSGGSVARYLSYGASYEAKLRNLARTPNLPANSVLYAGWLDSSAMQNLPAADVTVYGMSFSGNLATAMRKVRPDLEVRSVGGPGAPLNHTYAIYQLERPLRKTRVAVIGATSAAVAEVLLMNRGSLFSDSPFPYFFPRYRMDHGAVVRAADSLINSASELNAAFADPDLWRRQLAVLDANDDGYNRFFFAADALDDSALGRLVRRGLAKHHQQAYAGGVFGPRGYNRDHEAVQVFRGILRQMVREVRAENVQPIVALFALQGYGNHLYEMVADILRDDAIPYMNTYDICSTEDRGNYLPDLHFVPACDTAFARRIIDLSNTTLSDSR